MFLTEVNQRLKAMMAPSERSSSIAGVSEKKCPSINNGSISTTETKVDIRLFSRYGSCHTRE